MNTFDAIFADVRGSIAGDLPAAKLQELMDTMVRTKGEIRSWGESVATQTPRNPTDNKAAYAAIMDWFLVATELERQLTRRESMGERLPNAGSFRDAWREGPNTRQFVEKRRQALRDRADGKTIRGPFTRGDDLRS